MSLIPSATEIVCALGLRDQLVGVTHECDFPGYVKNLPKVTQSLIPATASSGEIDRLVREQLDTQASLYSLNFPVLEQLQPDLIVTQALCDVCAVSEREVQAAVCTLPGRPRVINLEPTSLSDVLNSISSVAKSAGISRRGEDLLASLAVRLSRVSRISERISQRPRVVLLEWIDPPFSAGHWSPELIDIAGGVEVVGQARQKSRTVLWDEIVRAQPEAMIIACCGFDIERTLEDLPLLARNPGFFELPCTRTGNLFVVDGNAYFSRPGPRLVDAAEILAHALHPSIHALPPELKPARRLSVEDFNECAS